MVDVSTVPEVLAVPDLLVHVAIAIAIGGLIGLERERLDKFAGVRTLALLSGTAPAVVELAERDGPLNWLLCILGSRRARAGYRLRPVRTPVRRNRLHDERHRLPGRRARPARRLRPCV
ncbi:MgtC/SapB family protein [Halovenus salina]|uniref:MgtC/SapB family protein n=1 Tax=Halovenus salina TaxID=1510225 RepID=A0ABD5VYJ7_9EURY